jgi:hypothetical protein
VNTKVVVIKFFSENEGFDFLVSHVLTKPKLTDFIRFEGAFSSRRVLYKNLLWQTKLFKCLDGSFPPESRQVQISLSLQKGINQFQLGLFPFYFSYN